MAEAQIPDTMMALQLTGVGMETVELREVEVPRPEADQVLCRVECAAACASDSKIIDQGPEHSLMHGWDPVKWPVTLGHEGCVTAIEVGANWEDKIEVGGRYAVQPAVPSAPSRHRDRYSNDGRGIRKAEDDPSEDRNRKRETQHPFDGQSGKDGVGLEHGNDLGD